LITGVAGFIGFSLALKLLKKNKLVLGIDNLNQYYDINLKKSRLKILKKYKNFSFLKIDLTNDFILKKKLNRKKIKSIYHMAAQAGVRYSLEAPREYIKSNIIGFFNILELSKTKKIKHLIYASSSSVYGANKNFPFDEKNSCTHPIQLYAATKISNESMAHSYSSLYNLPTSGIRFFTVYGPWGRPDQALFIFTKNILNKKKINLFNYGNHTRDFTYIDDIVNGIEKIGNSIPKGNKKWNPKKPNPSFSKYPYQIYNIASDRKVKLTKYLDILEKKLNMKAKIKYLPLQKGDVPDVRSSIKKIKNKLNYKPKIKVEIGISRFVDWYKTYYNK
ncbi:GDP-mannose 4,6-dehydratase, partial [Candidatus Pelagibacter sp.]|nr:GDP-mannose 4,6-dehydratase [Candidatus Pelagibacter sp.]